MGFTVVQRSLPRLRFCLNRALDKQVCFDFLKHKKGGLNFGKNIIKAHPSLTSVKKLSESKQKQAIGQYVDQFYQIHKEQLKKIRQEFQKEWNKKSADFFKEVDQIFDHHPWPKGPYFSYISIFPCGPRFLKERSFQVFYLRRPRLRPVTHEMLHFLFYDYIEKNFPKEDSSSEAIWIFSEIINTLVLDGPQFRKIIGVPYRHPYPAQKELLNQLKPLWERKKDLHSFFKENPSMIKDY